MHRYFKCITIAITCVPLGEMVHSRCAVEDRILFHCGDLGGVETTDFDSGFFGSLQSETWLYFVG